MVCTSCKAKFTFTAKVYADKQCTICRREDNVNTHLVVEPDDPWSGGRRQFLSDLKVDELRQSMKQVTKVELLAPMIELKATY